jgi:pimeloyl-ACP methyl ester carboxylesterase
MSVELARGVGPARIDIAYEQFGGLESPPVLLIMGLGTQMLGWPDGFCAALASTGAHVIRFDNRDIRARRGRADTEDPLGIGRQFVAIAASGDRTAALRSVSVPTLVVHGADDPLVDVSGGRATARALPGAELVVFEGMGHDLPRPLGAELVRRIGELVDRAEVTRR